MAGTSARRVAVVGGGPSGIVAAKYLLSRGFQPTLFEQSGDIGGQWNCRSPHSGIWPAMRTNTSRLMTQFSDLQHPPGTAVYPRNQEVLGYLHRYAEAFEVTKHVRLHTRVECVEQAEGGYRITSHARGSEPQVEDFPFVVIASGRYTQPSIPAVPGLASFSGKGGVFHTSAYKLPARLRGMRVLVAGCAISALEIASDLAMSGAARVVTSYRRQRYILPKLAAGVPTDHLFFTRWAAYAEDVFPPEVMLSEFRDAVLRVSGSPEQFGAMRPDADIGKAGVTLCQHFLPLVAEARIGVKPWMREIDRDRVTFTDGSAERFDAVVFGTGFTLNLPFLSKSLQKKLHVDEKGLDLYQFTFHPDLPGLAFMGMYDQSGPYFPVLELQARWLAYTWAGTVARASEHEMWESIRESQPAGNLRLKQAMHRMAVRFARLIGADPDPSEFPALARALLFGPMAAISFRMHGPDSLPDATELFAEETAAFGAPSSPALTAEELAKWSALEQAQRQTAR